MISSCRVASSAATASASASAVVASTRTSAVRTYSAIAAANTFSTGGGGILNAPRPLFQNTHMVQHPQAQQLQQQLQQQPLLQQQQQQPQQRRSMKGGSRGARGHGWFLKYRQGLGGRHLQGKFWDRDVEYLEEWNDQILELGSTLVYINVKVGGSASGSASTDGAEPTTTTTTATTKDYTLHLQCATAALPETCQNFIQLGLDGYYDNTTFYRMEAQTGLAAGDVQHLQGKGGHCHPDMGIYGVLKMESMVLRHTQGMVTMLCPGVDRVDSRFFCCTHDAPQLDGYHVPFAKLTPESMDIVHEWQKTIYTKRGKPTVDMVITNIGLVEEEEKNPHVVVAQEKEPQVVAPGVSP